MNRSLHKRQKLGHLPGDLPKRNLIEMLEKGKTILRYGSSHPVVAEGGKGIKHRILTKERAVLKERFQDELKRSDD